MKLGIAEIFQKVEAAESTEDRVNILRQNGTDIHNTTLFFFLKYMFEAEAQWHPDLPRGKVKYKPCPYFDQQPALYQKLKLFPRLFFAKSQLPMDAEKRRLLYVQTLEALDPFDAELVENIRLRKTKGFTKNAYPSITRELIDTAFPGLIIDAQA